MNLGVLWRTIPQDTQTTTSGIYVHQIQELTAFPCGEHGSVVGGEINVSIQRFTHDLRRRGPYSPRFLLGRSRI